MEKQALAVREQQWYQTITTAKQSGQSIKSWCAENGVPLSSFYSWQRKMRSALLRQESVQFEELSPSSPKTAAIDQWWPFSCIIAITPCTAEHPMSFKVPDRLLTDGQCRMMINGIQFIQALLEANELAVGKDHQFKGRYEAEKNAVIISLEKDEREW